MNRTLLFIIVSLSAAYLLGLPRAREIMIIAASGYMLIGGITWLVTRRLPNHFLAGLVSVFLGPMAIVVILHFLVDTMQELQGHAPALMLLGIVIASVVLGVRLFRRKSKLI